MSIFASSVNRQILEPRGETPFKAHRDRITPTARNKSTAPKRESQSQRLEFRVAFRKANNPRGHVSLAAVDLAVEGASRRLDEHRRTVLQGGP
jgi:hypothetical protein